MPQSPIYLDNHATTRVDPRVLDAMLPYFSEQYGNAASINHRFGDNAREAVEIARVEIAKLVGATPESVVLTSGATEANNLAIKGIFSPLLRRRVAESGQAPHLIVNSAEHRAVLDPAKRLKRNGAAVTTVSVNEFGQVSPSTIIEALRPETKLVSVMRANNEIGSINPLPGISRVCRERKVLLHCDAVQAAGRMPIDFADSGIDLLTLSAHKIYGPKGIGALMIRRGEDRIPLEPLIDGGGHEGQLRSGTLPVPLIVGFAEACRIAREDGATESARIVALRDELWQQLSNRLDGLHLNGHPTERICSNLNVSFEGVDGDVLMNAMTEIAVSSGSACTSADPEPSHVLRAIGRSDQLTRASLRFGIGRFNTDEDIAFAADFVVKTVESLRHQ